MLAIYLIFVIQCVIDYMTQSGHKNILLGRRMVTQVYMPLTVILSYLLRPLLFRPNYIIEINDNNKSFWM